MARTILQRRTVVGILCLLLIASGTPQVLARDAAQDALFAQAAARQKPEAANTYASIGVPPDDLARAMSAPTASGANPLYPVNHTFDAIPPQIVGTPPANHDFNASGYSLGTVPTNYDLEAAGQSVGTPPTNYDFGLDPLWWTGQR